ncbi:hypothetical protein [Paenibacillus segetis]|uniref:Uncharacterized protein n=1 Tax=Paenibacillus segetis TaxID=1325360 RepID=A0ABQ1YBP2_9BACL|nr:hypothetical protein [Paenibacillus segetis]GGH20102.1 hypothetical protein GCM10008013_17260 [Paenibacillus segetis]
MKNKPLRLILICSLVFNIILIYLTLDYRTKINTVNESTFLPILSSNLDSLPKIILNNIDNKLNGEIIISNGIDNTLNTLGHFILIGEDTGWLSDKDKSELWSLYKFIDSAPRKREVSDGRFSEIEKTDLIKIAKILNEINWTNIKGFNRFLNATYEVLGNSEK